jgi:hypothetical protein
MKDEFYAHSREGKPPEDWHRLEDHLKAVADMARSFADGFNAGDWGPILLDSRTDRVFSNEDMVPFLG